MRRAKSISHTTQCEAVPTSTGEYVVSYNQLLIIFKMFFLLFIFGILQQPDRQQLLFTAAYMTVSILNQNCFILDQGIKNTILVAIITKSLYSHLGL